MWSFGMHRIHTFDHRMNASREREEIECIMFDRNK